MIEYIAQLTPENPADLVMEAWEHVVENELDGLIPSLEGLNSIRNRGFFSNPEVGPVIERVAKICDLKQKQVRTYLRTLKISQVRKIGGKSVRVYEIGGDDFPVTSDEFLL